ncbi:hypothetical protein GCM10009817_02750 [Terrabacter lapilli]|uniref:ABC transporter permease n=1 Tax=Terrabacter lapilli TaxID=436231 RepID=A0ABN2RB15_9MICO
MTRERALAGSPEGADARPSARAVRAARPLWLVATGVLVLASPVLVMAIGDALARADPPWAARES